jgi:transposase
MKEAAELVGIGYRTLQDWVAWYRHGGLTEVLQRIKGHGNQGRPANLAAIQQKALAAKVALGNFRNVWDAIQWVRDRWNVQYSYSGLFKRLKCLKCHLKVPRPRSVKTDIEAQNEWKATGLAEALRGAEMTRVHRISGAETSELAPGRSALSSFKCLTAVNKFTRITA